MTFRAKHIAYLLLLVFFSACRDDKRVVDESRPLNNHTWSYSDKMRFDVKITDASKPYDLYLNLRHTPYYAYSNFFAIIHQISPEKKRYSMRFEFKLAQPDGEWLGQGSGNLYSHQIVFRKNYKFPKAGTYRIDIEQNMRDNPLKEITDAGLRVEEAN
ncbi:MAG: gliding motility lipoprotein GldH [Mucilaginibacter polytrichastri]|nr:gliding motility lipoprotein GldH [Mucilaginibacter polytrichastri]